MYSVSPEGSISLIIKLLGAYNIPGTVLGTKDTELVGQNPRPPSVQLLVQAGEMVVGKWHMEKSNGASGAQEGTPLSVCDMLH